MLQTSVICGLALLVFLVSPFAPIARFGVVMALMLGLALVGDLLLLPALLESRWGRLFASYGLFEGTKTNNRSSWNDCPQSTGVDTLNAD